MNKLLILLLCSVCVLNGQEVDSLVLKDLNRAKNLVVSNVPAALDIATTALITSRNNDFDLGIAESYLVAGQCYIQTGDGEAKKVLEYALKFAEKTANKALISDCYFNLGKYCFIDGDTKSQLSYYKKAFDLRKTLNDERRIADSYHAYGNVYLALKQDSLAESYFLLAKDIRTKLNDLNGLAAISNNLGLLADRKGQTALYRKLMYDAIKLNEQTGNKRYLATNHGNLGVSYFKEKSFDSAWFHGRIAYDIRKDNNFKDHLAGTYTDLGNVLFEEKKYSEALAYYNNGAKLAESISGYEWMLGNYLALSKTYEVLDSQELHLKYKSMADKLTKEHESDTLLSRRIPLPPAFDFKEPESSSPVWYWWAGGGTLLLCLVGFGFYKRRK